VERSYVGRVGWWLLASLPLLAFLTIPVVALVLAGLKGPALEQLGSQESREAISLSLRTTLVSVALILGLGTPLAFVLGRCHFPLRGLIDGLVTLPAVLPPAAAGIALLLAFGRMGLLGSALEGMGITLAFTPTAVILAQTFVAAPFYLREATAAFAAHNRTIEEVAVMDGAGAWTLLSKIILPIASPHLISGATLAWARALGEFGATILFAGNLAGVTQTMPLAIYLGLESSLEQASALAVLLLAAAAIVLLVSRLATSRFRRSALQAADGV
jgi:molybdate transport system permease protein